MDSIEKTIFGLIRIARPVHWTKNIAVFAGIVFAGQLFEKAQMTRVIEAFITFCLASSATYVINDILDRGRDRMHPIKKHRPIASGVISIPLALAFASGLVLSSLFLASRISDLFTFMILGYLLLQAAYSLYLKHIAVVDIMVIATGFVLRIYAGAYIIDAHLSVWFLLCVISTALFLASGKRRAELGAIGATGETRKSLVGYNKEALNSYVTMFGNASWMSWALFTFFESPRASEPLVLFLSEISRTTTINKLLMITIPVAIFGIMRYQGLISSERTEAPEKILLKDVSLVTAIAIWVGIVLIVYYGGVTG
jgi:4-hydroxybenzoate polyprenyltransferase